MQRLQPSMNREHPSRLPTNPLTNTLSTSGYVLVDYSRSQSTMKVDFFTPKHKPDRIFLPDDSVLVFFADQRHSFFEVCYTKERPAEKEMAEIRLEIGKLVAQHMGLKFRLAIATVRQARVS